MKALVMFNSTLNRRFSLRNKPVIRGFRTSRNRCTHRCDSKIGNNKETVVNALETPLMGFNLSALTVHDCGNPI